jgi:hypothetical protein
MVACGRFEAILASPARRLVPQTLAIAADHCENPRLRASLPSVNRMPVTLIRLAHGSAREEIDVTGL